MPLIQTGNYSSRYSTNSNPYYGEPLLEFYSSKTKSMPPVVITTIMMKDLKSDSKELNIIKFDELNKMDLIEIDCFNCGKCRHFTYGH